MPEFTKYRIRQYWFSTHPKWLKRNRLPNKWILNHSKLTTSRVQQNVWIQNYPTLLYTVSSWMLKHRFTQNDWMYTWPKRLSTKSIKVIKYRITRIDLISCLFCLSGRSCVPDRKINRKYKSSVRSISILRHFVVFFDFVLSHFERCCTNSFRVNLGLSILGRLGDIDLERSWG